MTNCCVTAFESYLNLYSLTVNVINVDKTAAATNYCSLLQLDSASSTNKHIMTYFMRISQFVNWNVSKNNSNQSSIKGAGDTESWSLFEFLEKLLKFMIFFRFLQGAVEYL